MVIVNFVDDKFVVFFDDRIVFFNIVFLGKELVVDCIDFFVF